MLARARQMTNQLGHKYERISLEQSYAEIQRLTREPIRLQSIYIRVHVNPSDNEQPSNQPRRINSIKYVLEPHSTEHMIKLDLSALDIGVCAIRNTNDTCNLDDEEMYDDLTAPLPGSSVTLTQTDALDHVLQNYFFLPPNYKVYFAYNVHVHNSIIYLLPTQDRYITADQAISELKKRSKNYIRS